MRSKTNKGLVDSRWLKNTWWVLLVMRILQKKWYTLRQERCIFLCTNPSSLSAVWSTISYLCKLAGVKRPEQYVSSMNTFLGGMKRKTQAAMHHLSLNIVEVTSAMPLEVYEKTFFSEKEDVFYHLFWQYSGVL